MAALETLGIEQARANFPQLINAAAGGAHCVITKHGKPCAIISPISENPLAQSNFLSLIGTGKGLWGKRSSATVDSLRSEWGDA